MNSTNTSNNINNKMLYRDQDKIRQPPKKDVYPDELGAAIQHLIQRLRESNPIKRVG